MNSEINDEVAKKIDDTVNVKLAEIKTWFKKNGKGDEMKNESSKEIILRGRIAQSYKHLLDLLTSWEIRHKKNPKTGIVLEAEKILLCIFTAPDVIKDSPYYLAAAIINQIRFTETDLVYKQRLNGTYPDWAEIRRIAKIKESLHPQFTELKENGMDKRITYALFLAFCLKNRAHVKIDEIEIASGDLYQNAEYEERKRKGNARIRN